MSLFAGIYALQGEEDRAELPQVSTAMITRTQWQPTRAKWFWASQPFVPCCWEAMTRTRFPSTLFRWPVVFLAYALHRARIRDYGYLIKLFVKFSDYFERCGGRLVFPE